MTGDRSSRPRRLVGVSTKMYFGVQQTKEYVHNLLAALGSKSEVFKDVDVFLIPDFISLSAIVNATRESKIRVGGQNCSHMDHGSLTGEISPLQLKDVGCELVELGHAERRRMFGETDQTTAEKAAAACRNGLTPLVCIGEKTRGEIALAVDECRPQVEAVLDAIPPDSEVIFAYEPVWAIGQPEPAEAEHVVGVTQAIRKLCQDRAGCSRLLYGGSAGPGLFQRLADGCDGLFLGRFAHQISAFVQTIQEICDAS